MANSQPVPRGQREPVRRYMRAYYLSHGAIGRERSGTRGLRRQSKVCKACGEMKTRAEFVIRKTGARAGAFGAYCLRCTARRQLERNHSLSSSEISEMLYAQSGVCAICLRALDASYKAKGQARMVVDHDHRTNRVRGLLCNACNTAVGVFQDDPVILNRAAAYVQKHRDGEA